MPTDYEAQLKAANEEVYKHSLELARLKEELEVTNERQEGLLHFIGHEVKGFLTKDEGSFAALLDGDIAPLPDTLKPFVTSALAQSRDGARSVTDILTASNQKKGTIAYDKAPFDLRALVESVVAKEQPMAADRGLTLTLHVNEDAGLYTLLGDKDKMGDNVLRNLIENAIHYTPQGSITANLTKDDGKIAFSVSDTGIGITEEDKKRLFTEGGHGKDSMRVNVHSTGYGLFIAKNIVEAHGGTIKAESEGQGSGSRFTIEFPAAA